MIVPDPGSSTNGGAKSCVDVPLLTREGEVELFWTIEQDNEDSQWAREEMFTSNLPLVMSVASRYAMHPQNLRDLFQEGCIGLMRAIDKFDYKRGYKFSTYAIWWIRQAVTRAQHHQGRMIRIPSHVIDDLTKVQRFSAWFSNTHGRAPTASEISEHISVPVLAVQKLLTVVGVPVSLDQPTRESVDRTPGETVVDNKMTPQEEVIAHDLGQKLRLVLKTLTAKEEQILRMRYGIDEESEHTLREVGQAFDVTRERVRQIEIRALAKLRHPSRSKFLGEPGDAVSGRVKAGRNDLGRSK